MLSSLFTQPAVACLAVFASTVLASNLDLSHEFRGMLIPRQTATNLQSFTGALGGVVASPITESSDSSRPFEVDGSTFPDFATAAQRSCSNQKNGCSDAANANKNAGFSVGDCDKQNTDCNSAQKSATATAFAKLTTSDAEFDYFCDP